MADFSSTLITGMEAIDSVRDTSGDFANLFEITAVDAFFYKMRAVDDGLAAPGYIHWIATVEDFSASQAPPTVGSIVPGSVIVISRWRAA